MKTRVVQIRQNGGPEVLELMEQTVPAPAAGEVLLQHRAVGLNFIDVYQRSGLYQLPLPLKRQTAACDAPVSIRKLTHP